MSSTSLSPTAALPWITSERPSGVAPNAWTARRKSFWQAAAVSGVPRALLRTALIALVLPPLFRDDDGRGWHDLAARSVVVRTR